VINESSTIEQVATLVCAALDGAGILVVLSGGAAVSISSDNEYGSLAASGPFGSRKVEALSARILSSV
jgi:hypothetical protein